MMNSLLEKSRSGSSCSNDDDEEDREDDDEEEGREEDDGEEDDEEGKDEVDADEVHIEEINDEGQITDDDDNKEEKKTDFYQASEEDEDDFESSSMEEGDDEEQNEEETDQSSEEISGKIHGNAFLTQLKQIMELRNLHKRVNSRLSWAKGNEDSRLKKAESRVTDFFGHPEEREGSGVDLPVQKDHQDGQETDMKKTDYDVARNCNHTPSPTFGRKGRENVAFSSLLSKNLVVGLTQESEVNSNEESDPNLDDPGDILVWKPNSNKSLEVHETEGEGSLGGDSPVERHLNLEGSFHVEEYPTTAQIQTVKRPYLKKRSGLVRFYKTESTAEACSPVTDKSRVKRLSAGKKADYSKNSVSCGNSASEHKNEIVINAYVQRPKPGHGKPMNLNQNLNEASCYQNKVAERKGQRQQNRRRSDTANEANYYQNKVVETKGQRQQNRRRSDTANEANCYQNKVVETKGQRQQNRRRSDTANEANYHQNKVVETKGQRQQNRCRSNTVNTFDTRRPNFICKGKAVPTIELPILATSTANSDSVRFDGENKPGKKDFLEKKELKIFEKMEKLTGRASFCSDTSFVDKFIKDDLSFDGSLIDTADDIDQRKSNGTEVFTEEFKSAVRRKLNEQRKNTVNLADTTSYVVLQSGQSAVRSVDTIREETDVSQVPPIPLISDVEHLRQRYCPQYQQQDKNLVQESGASDKYSENLAGAMMIKLHEQGRVAEKLQHQTKLVIQFREELEKKDLDLQQEKSAFEKYKKEELLKLETYKKKMQRETEGIEKISAEAGKIRELNLDYKTKLNEIRETMKNVEVEWKRKANRWETTHKKLQARIKTAEEEKKRLEAEIAVLSNAGRIERTSPQTLPKFNNGVPKKIHFADEIPKTSVDTIMPVNFHQNELMGNKPSKPIGYFSATQKNARGLERGNRSHRSTLKANTTNEKTIPDAKKPVGNSNNCSTESHNQDLHAISSSVSSTNWYDEKIITENVEMVNKIPVTCKVDSTKRHEKNYETYTNVDMVGDTETLYSNGTRKYVSKEKKFTRVFYKNGDIKETRPDGSRHYFFAELGIKQSTYPNGFEMTSYPNGPIKRKNPDGTAEILYPNGCVKFLRSNGQEDYIFPDNTFYQVAANGEVILSLPNGQKEIHTSTWKRRIFPDGSMKTLFQDGTTETKYHNGRIRIRNAAGKLVSDTIEKGGIRIPYPESEGAGCLDS